MKYRTGKAEVTFRSAEEGGREKPPVPVPGEWQYRPVAVFEGQASGPWCFTLGMRFQGPADSTGTMYGDIRFLAEEAPHHFIVPGARFRAYEGARLVAYGKVLEVYPEEELDVGTSEASRVDPGSV